MKTPALALLLGLLLSSVSAGAQNRQWKDATVAKTTTETANGGLAVVQAALERTQQQYKTPDNGNELLDWCNRLLGPLDSASEYAQDPHLTENMMKAGWCAGYVGGIRDATIISERSFVMATSKGVKLTGPFPDIVENILREAGAELPPPKTARELAIPFSMICIPREATTVGQLTRVVVKWLRDHPARLHEQMTNLTLDALKDAFPCQANVPTKKPDNQ